MGMTRPAQSRRSRDSFATLHPNVAIERAAPTRRARLLGVDPILMLAILFLSLFAPSFAFAAQPLDVIFVLDNSGSMKENDPEFLTRRAVADFADALANENKLDGRIAIILFDGQARLVQRLTPAGDIASTRLLGDALDELDFSGQRTNSPSGIERALYELRERGRADAEQAIVFLSDGKIDTGDSANDLELGRWLREDLAGESAAGKIRIFGIAFTEDADYQLMQAIARRTKGSYYRAFAAGELATVVDDVLAKVAAPQLAGRNPFEPESTDGAEPSNPPNVAAAPLSNSEEEATGSGPGLLALLPVALLLVGGALFYRHRGGNLGALGALARPAATRNAPPAQLLDIGGQAGATGRAFALANGRTTIGRDAHNDIVLSDDTISSEHALIENRDGRYWVQDLRSTNGTRLADKRLDPDERIPLKGGDHVRFADIDLMFVMKGYVPGGATVYLSSSTMPPADWSAIAASSDPGIDVAVPEEAPQSSQDIAAVKKSASPAHAESATPSSVSSADDVRDAPSGEVAFAEQRVRLDPATVVDLDEELGASTADHPLHASEMNSQSPSESAIEQSAILRAEAALAEIESQEDASTTDETSRPVLSLLPPPAEHNEEAQENESDDSIEVAEVTLPEALRESEASEQTDRREGRALPESSVDASGSPRAEEIGAAGSSEADLSQLRLSAEQTSPSEAAAELDAASLRRALDYHLSRVAEISPPFAEFVERAFQEELRDALPVAACELIEGAKETGQIAQREYTFDRIRYLICGIPGAMDTAQSLFMEGAGGFTRVLTEQLQSESFRADRCEILAILTFGHDVEPWVSLSIIPDEGQDPRIDLLSYEFLTETERREIEPSVDPEISQSGLA